MTAINFRGDYKINRTSNNQKIFDLNLKGGHIYLVSFSYDEKNDVVIHIEEI